MGVGGADRCLDEVQRVDTSIGQHIVPEVGGGHHERHRPGVKFWFSWLQPRTGSEFAAQPLVFTHAVRATPLSQLSAHFRPVVNDRIMTKPRRIIRWRSAVVDSAVFWIKGLRRCNDRSQAIDAPAEFFVHRQIY